MEDSFPPLLVPIGPMVFMAPSYEQKPLGGELSLPAPVTTVQSGHRDKNILGLTRVPYDLRFPYIFLGFLKFS